MTDGQKPNHTNWLACEAYVLRRHMLPNAKFESGRLVADLCQPHEAINCKDALDWIYQLLSAMDGKASALMRLNGVMLAAAAFLLGGAKGSQSLQIARYDEIAIAITAAASALSIFLCLKVVNVSWYFLGKVTEAGGKLDYTTEFEMLQKTAKGRQLAYRYAWWISAGASLLFVAEFLRQFLYVAFRWIPL